jgi:hypothetical protein
LIRLKVLPNLRIWRECEESEGVVNATTTAFCFFVVGWVKKNSCNGWHKKLVIGEPKAENQQMAEIRL